jgi:carboxyl-terminal processing protease
MRSTGFRSGSVLLTFIISTMLGSASWAAMKTEKEYWQQTHLKYDQINIEINNQSCYRNQKSFLGCAVALNAIGRFATPPIAVASSEERTVMGDVFGVPISSDQSLFVVPMQMDNSKPSFFERFKVERQRMLAQETALTEMYKRMDAPAAERIDWSALSTYFRTRAVTDDNEQLVTATAFNAWFETIFDPHTHIFPAKEFSDRQDPDAKSFIGIGAPVTTAAGQIVFGKPLAGSPAEAAQLQTGDVLLTVDGKVPAGIEDAVNSIHGIEGTSVKLSIRRKGVDQPLVISLIRRKVSSPNFIFKAVTDSGSKYGYIHLNEFTTGSCDQMKWAIQHMVAEKVKGLIFDLRDNGGGLVNEAVCIGDLFVGPRVIVMVGPEENIDSTDRAPVPPDETRETAMTDLPMITLINAGSASASEIVSGALQVYHRSWIAGDRSFGKATVQNVHPWEAAAFPKEISLAETVQRFYQPDGSTNQIVGIVPDLHIDVKPNATAEDMFFAREEDLYLNAFQKIQSPHAAADLASITQVEKCVVANGQAQQNYEQQKGAGADYQLLVAQDQMNCILRLNVINRQTAELK